MSHTPGPWHVGGVGGCRPQIIYSPSGLAVLRTWGGATKAEEEANARMAASAPEMLEALRAIMPYLEEDPDDEGDYNARVRAARAAIAKAEGK